MMQATETEQLNRKLDDPQALAAYAAPYDHYRAGWFARFLGTILIKSGDVVYGKKPSYLKFRAIEIVARVPYHSWESAVYTLLTLFFSNPRKAMQLSEMSRFARLAQDNETMHVVVISELARRHARAGFIRHTLIPMLFAFGYFWALYWLYFISRKQSLELNYLFEDHAFRQYSEFIETHEERLKAAPLQSAFLAWYGREAHTEYAFFRSVRNDEIIHRNASVQEILA